MKPARWSLARPAVAEVATAAAEGVAAVVMAAAAAVAAATAVAVRAVAVAMVAVVKAAATAGGAAEGGFPGPTALGPPGGAGVGRGEEEGLLFCWGDFFGTTGAAGSRPPKPAPWGAFRTGLLEGFPATAPFKGAFSWQQIGLAALARPAGEQAVQ